MCESYIGATEKSVARIRVSQAGQFIRSMFWIGCIGFGGGSALIPVIEKEIADRQGIDEKQNIDKDVVVASITPGALPVEIAASIGHRKFGIRGMIAGAVMMALPGALMTVALVAVLSVFQEKILSVVNMISIGVSVFLYQKNVKRLRGRRKTQKDESDFFNAWGFCTVFFYFFGAGTDTGIFQHFFHQRQLQQKESDNSYRHYWQLSVDTCTSVFV